MKMFRKNKKDELEPIIRQLKGMKKPKITMLCPGQCAKMYRAAALLERCCPEGRIELGIQPDFFLGSVRAEAEDFAEIKAMQLAEAFSLADLAEIYPLTNGRIRIELTFHHLTTVIK